MLTPHERCCARAALISTFLQSSREVPARFRLAFAGTLCAALVLFPGAAAAESEACDTPSPWPPRFAFPSLPVSTTSARVGAREVTIERDGTGFVYHVAGQADIVRGMGYNPRLAPLPMSERRAVLERDFEAMRDMGVNTVFGWDPAEFDGLLLDVADEHGLGVAMPYDVDFSADLANPAVSGSARDEAVSLVQRYRGHPALRMWAVGNELLQRTVPPDWCPPEAFDESGAGRARALARFVLETADVVHQLDPAHPVIYREAEDAYTSWLTDALRDLPASRPWLIYGVNAFTPRLGSILDGLPGRGIDGPVLVSEFAPWEGERGSRAEGLRDLWGQIRARERQVIGASVYVWFTDGPEHTDQRFGLVDALGQPVDDAFETVAELFGGVRRPR